MGILRYSNVNCSQHNAPTAYFSNLWRKTVNAYMAIMKNEAEKRSRNNTNAIQANDNKNITDIADVFGELLESVSSGHSDAIIRQFLVFLNATYTNNEIVCGLLLVVANIGKNSPLFAMLRVHAVIFTNIRKAFETVD